MMIGLVLLVVVLIIVCGGAFILFQSTNQPAPPPTATPTADPSIPTAREAYPPAIDMIRDQDPGAELASAAGAWTPTIVLPDLVDGRTGWTFHFYLPAKNQMAWVTVGRDREVRLARVEDWETPPTLLDDEAWQVDSPQAIQIALGSACQATLDDAPDAEVQARLSLDVSNGALIWQIRVFPAADPNAACSARIDATSGTVR